MNTINISGWRACACGFERRALLVLAVVCATAMIARAQTGTFPIIDGAGVGGTVVVIGGVVVGPGATNGNLAAAHPPTCIGPEYHFHGVLNGVIDPDPLGCGWGHVNYTALVPSSPVTAPTVVMPPALPARPRMTFTRPQPTSRQTVTEAAVQPEPQPAFVPGTPGDVLALKYDRGLLKGGRIFPSTVALRKTFTQFAALDAQHAMKQTPRPLPREEAATSAASAPRRSSFWHFSLTGPKAKLIPTPAQSSP